MLELQLYGIGDIVEVIDNQSSGFPEGTIVKVVEHGFWSSWFFTTNILDMDFSDMTTKEINTHPRVRAHSARELRLVKKS